VVFFAKNRYCRRILTNHSIIKNTAATAVCFGTIPLIPFNEWFFPKQTINPPIKPNPIQIDNEQDDGSEPDNELDVIKKNSSPNIALKHVIGTILV